MGESCIDVDPDVNELHDEVTRTLEFCALEDNLPNRYDMFDIKYKALQKRPLNQEIAWKLETINKIQLHILLQMEKLGIPRNLRPFKSFKEKSDDSH